MKPHAKQTCITATASMETICNFRVHKAGLIATSTHASWSSCDWPRSWRSLFDFSCA